MEDNNKDLYRKFLDPLLAETESFSDSVYEDSNKNPTVGYGANLNSPEVRGMFNLMNIDYDSVRNNQRKLTQEEARKLKDMQIRDKEKYFNKLLGERAPASELNETKKAALMSMYYNNPELIGPNMINHLKNNDHLNVIKEMILNSNKDNEPGVLRRRLKEAELYGGPLDFSSSFKLMEDKEKQQILNIINQTKNEELKKELLQKYSPYINPKQQLFNKILKP